MNTRANDRRGVYNIEYFSGTQAAIYIGDVLVDEVTSFAFQVSQSRTPLYGYADQKFRDVSKGVILVQGSFAINFKEAGYLWLILNRYREKVRNETSLLGEIGKKPLGGSTFDPRVDRNIEKMVNGELGAAARNELLQDLANISKTPISYDRMVAGRKAINNTANGLQGFASNERQNGRTGGLGLAENIFEAFEDRIWEEADYAIDGNYSLQSEVRRVDDPALNPFDIFVTFGDYNGNDSHNHTVKKLINVHILSASIQTSIDGQPIQEVYEFIAQDLV